MRDVLLELPEQLRWYAALRVPLQIKRPQRIFYCGMGGAALAAEMLNDYWYNAEPGLQIIRDYTLPAHVGVDDLVIIASYSGNTEEVLHCLQQAQERHAQLVAITNGGIIEDYTRHNFVYHVHLPDLAVARLATGYFLSALVYVLQHAGFEIDFPHEELANHLFENLSGAEERGRELATQIGDRLPIFYTTADLASVVRSNKIKMNETAKTQCFWNVWPELNHNEMVGWTNWRVSPFFIFWIAADMHERNFARLQVMQALWEERGWPSALVRLRGNTPWEKILFGQLVGDYLAYFVAEQTKTNPLSLKLVEDFKKRLHQETTVGST